jgi:predicted nucleic acid-binding protein
VKTSFLVDSNVLIDALGGPGDLAWSSAALVSCARLGELVVNPVIWAELAAMRPTEEQLEKIFERLPLRREPLPMSAAFPAGRAHIAYRKSGGARERTLPDFLIGAHAAISDYTLLTRDAARYRTYFPELDIVSPEIHPSGAPAA